MRFWKKTGLILPKFEDREKKIKQKDRKDK